MFGFSLQTPVPTLESLLAQIDPAKDAIDLHLKEVQRNRKIFDDVELLLSTHYAGQTVQYNGKVYEIKKPFKRRYSGERYGRVEVTKIDKVIS